MYMSFDFNQAFVLQNCFFFFLISSFYTFLITMDKRFSKIAVDPKFKRIPKGERKVKIDKRFQSIFNDNKFKVKYTIDKRGRPLHTSTTEDFKKFYHLSDDDTNSEQNSSDDIVQETENQLLVVDKKSIVGKKINRRHTAPTVDYARGNGVLLSDSSSDDDISSDEEKEGT